jgi:hypothetical protein
MCARFRSRVAAPPSAGPGAVSSFRYSCPLTLVLVIAELCPPHRPTRTAAKWFQNRRGQHGVRVGKQQVFGRFRALMTGVALATSLGGAAACSSGSVGDVQGGGVASMGSVGGSQGGVGAGSPMGGGGIASSAGAGASTLSCPNVPQAIFLPTCTSAACHNSQNPMQHLDLQSPNLAARLVGVPSTEGPGLLIDPAAPSNSVLYTKLSAAPPFGARMPLALAPLDSEAMDCVLAWITQQVSDGGGLAESGVGASSPQVPFEPLSVPVYVTKVKTVLTGLAPTPTEIAAVAADASALGGLVTAWMQLPQYTTRMELFFADAFQQSQASQTSFKTVIDDGTFTPNDGLLLNFRQSFAKTMTAVVAAGQPFNTAATTTSFMMTTAMMEYYAYADASMLTDATESGSGNAVFRFYDANKNWSWSVTSKTNIPLADSGNPSSPNYLQFYCPTLPMIYLQTDGQTGATAAHCAGIDPVVENAGTSFGLGSQLGVWLYSYLRGENFWYFDHDQGQGNATWCQAGGGTTDSHNVTHPAALTSADYSDWRMVSIQPVAASAPESRFFDIAGLRASSTLNLYENRIGYYTTPSFFAQYPTNISNQARGITNQTMIVGLGQAFDGSDAITVKNAPGLDPAHAANTACFQCHWSLDPMRRYFRSNYTLNFSTQQDPTQTSVPGSFLFDNVVDMTPSMANLGKQIASHPQFPIAWTQKLCAWANSAPCSSSDPELLRVAAAFSSSQFDWNTLVHALFTSPLVTYASATASAQASGTPVAIARRAQLCTTLGNRLGLNDVCGLQALQIGSCSTNCPASGATVPNTAANLPSDGYSRGAVSALYVNDPDPFYRSAIEQICALLADKVVDVGGGGTSLYSSATPTSVTSSIGGMVHNLMGLDSSRDTTPISILTSHYMAATSAGSTPTTALKSTFTLACLSPWVVSIGQ